MDREPSGSHFHDILASLKARAPCASPPSFGALHLPHEIQAYRPAFPESGARGAYAARRRDRRTRPALLPGRRALDFRRRLRRAAAAVRGAGGGFSRIACAVFADPKGRRRAVPEVREGETRRADAVARQRFCRRGSARIRFSRAPLPRLEGRRAARLHRRAEDRRALLLAALRARRTRAGRDARRRVRGRGCDGQCAHDFRSSAQTEGRSARRLGSARRSLHEPRRFRPTERTAGGGGKDDLRQSAQFGGGFAAPDRRRRDGAAAAALLRLCLGRSV